MGWDDTWSSPGARDTSRALAEDRADAARAADRAAEVARGQQATAAWLQQREADRQAPAKERYATLLASESEVRQANVAAYQAEGPAVGWSVSRMSVAAQRGYATHRRLCREAGLP